MPDDKKKLLWPATGIRTSEMYLSSAILRILFRVMNQTDPQHGRDPAESKKSHTDLSTRESSGSYQFDRIFGV